MQSKYNRKSTELLSPIEARVARKIGLIRREKGMMQRDLAKEAGLSAAYLSRVEGLKAALTLANLEKVAAALETPISAFLDEESEIAPLALYRRNMGKKGLLRGKGSDCFEMLAAGKKGKLMEPLIVDARSSDETTELHSHAGEEFDYVLEGSCIFYYGKQRIPMDTGDAVYYDATIPHAMQVKKNVRCRLLVVATSRDYLFHGDLSRLLADGLR